MNKIIVIGGSGFLGTYLVAMLRKNFNVIIGDIKPSLVHPELYKFCDITNKTLLYDICAGADTIVNLAAEHRDNVTPVSLYDDVNITGAINVCEVANLCGINNLVFTSSVAVYGFSNIVNDESAEINYFNDYGRTKWKAEQEYVKWRNLSNDNCLTIIRPTVIFGLGNRGNVYNLFNQIAKKRFIMIGNGNNKKSMAYVYNVCAFIEFCIHKRFSFEIFNYVDGPDYTMNKLVETIYHALGRNTSRIFRLPIFFAYLVALTFDLISKLTSKKFPISRIRIKKFLSSSTFDSKKSFEYGFVPPINLKNAIVKTIKEEFQN